MSVAGNIGGFFKKLFGWVKSFAMRSGLDEFIKEHWESALSALIAEARAHPGVPFHQWKQIVRGTIVRITGLETPGTWVDLLLLLTYESAKARKLL